jgi:hypothetical protein
MHKKIKVLWNGELLREIYPHASKWQVLKWKTKRVVRKAVIVSLALVSVAIVFKAGSVINPVTVYQDRQVIVEVTPVPSVMERIAKCESGGKHFGTSGQVLMRGNTNNTVDVGKYQINTVHFEAATKMGLDLTEEKDNEEFAMHLYKTQGTEPWKYSKHCWAK